MSEKIAWIMGITALGLIIFGSMTFSLIGLLSKEEVSITVVHTERITKNYSESREQTYLVFAENETFSCEDSLFYWKWNSSDMYGQMRPGTKWNATVVGFRIPFLSMYRNIIEVTPVKE